MKFEFRSYVRGGFYKPKSPSGATGYFTSMVPVTDYVIEAKKGDEGAFMAFWAMACVRLDATFDAEGMTGSYDFLDNVRLGQKLQGFQYGSPLPYLKWWKHQAAALLSIEESLAATGEVGVAVDFLNGNHLVGSGHWFVASAGCQAPGLKQGLAAELVEFSKAHAENEEIKPQEASISDSDRRSLVAVDSLSRGFLKLPQILRVFNFGPAKTASATPVLGADGFTEFQRRYLLEFRRYLGDYAVRLPCLHDRFLCLSDRLLSEEIYSLFSQCFRSSFPDAFNAERADEEIKAAKARKEREAKGPAPRTAP